jgi:cytochrome o ubiquinol oxidase operon protein cyoD
MTANCHSHSDHTGFAEKNVRTYVLGFALCLILTIFAFGLIKMNLADKPMVYILLTVFAVGQLLVQSVCFLGLRSDRDGKWSLLPFLFTLLIIFFLVGGSMWIMYNLNVLMMVDISIPS